LERDAECDIEDLILCYNAMIRFFFKENPERLDDVTFASRVQELRFLADNGFLRGINL
jgi:hypothetical protein